MKLRFKKRPKATFIGFLDELVGNFEQKLWKFFTIYRSLLYLSLFSHLFFSVEGEKIFTNQLFCQNFSFYKIIISSHHDLSLLLLNGDYGSRFYAGTLAKLSSVWSSNWIRSDIFHNSLSYMWTISTIYFYMMRSFRGRHP